MRLPATRPVLAMIALGIDVVVVREGKNLKGRLIGAMLGLIGKRFFSGQFQKTVQAVEARSAERT